MSDFFTTKGMLTVSIGEGYLSSFEASTLKKGDIVRTTRIAGMPSMMYFNGMPLCPCEVVVLGNIFGVRVTQRPCRDQEMMGLGARDDLVEILPTMVSLGTIRMSLAELKAAGPGTIISLGKPYAAEVDSELLVAGIPVAVGKVVALLDLGPMGIQIASVYGTAFKERNIRSSGFLQEPDSPSVKWVPYNFTMPDKFTVNNIMKMDTIHALFFRNLRAGLPGLADLLSDHSIHPAFVDQLNFGEVISTPPKDVKLKRFIAEVVPVRGLREAGRVEKASPTGVKGFLEEEGSPHPMDPHTRNEIEKMRLQMDMLMDRNPIVFFYRDEEGMRNIFERSEGQNVLLACLRGAWKNLVDLKIQPIAADEALARSQVLREQEMIVIVGFNGKDGRLGLSIVYPYRTLEPYMGLLE